MRLLSHPTAAAAVIASAGMQFNHSVRQSFYPIYLADIGMSGLSMGTLLAAPPLVSMCIRPFLGVLVTRFRLQPLLLAAMLTGALSIGLTPVVQGFWPLLLAAGLGGAGHGLSQPVTLLLLSSAVASREQGMAMGLRLWANRTAEFGGPLVLGVTAATFGLPATFLVAALGIVTAAGATMGLGRARRTLASSSDAPPGA